MVANELVNTGETRASGYEIRLIRIHRTKINEWKRFSEVKLVKNKVRIQHAPYSFHFLIITEYATKTNASPTPNFITTETHFVLFQSGLRYSKIYVNLQPKIGRACEGLGNVNMTKIYHF